MKRLPTDLEILQAIYDEYFDIYAAFDAAKPSRSTKNLVPLDVAKIAARLGTEKDIVFARLYYHLEHKHGYTNEDGAKVRFFMNHPPAAAPKEIHNINFL